MKNRKEILLVLGSLLVVLWVVHDFLLVREDKFEGVFGYSFENKTSQEVLKFMEAEARRMLSDVDEREQVIGFANITELNHYLLHTKKASTESYYDFINNILHPKQKASLKDKARYVYQVNKYLRRKRKTRYEYLKYEISEPEFFYEDFARNARVMLVRTTHENKKEHLDYCFRKYKGRYYLYLK